MAPRPPGMTTTRCQRVTPRSNRSRALAVRSFRWFLNKSLFIEDIEFKEGEKEHWVEIDILYDGQREMREAFTVHLKPDDNMVAEIQVRQRPRSQRTPQHRETSSPLVLQGGQRCIPTHVHAVMSACVKIAQAAAGIAVSVPEVQH